MRIAPVLLFAALATAGYFTLGPAVPHEQSLNVVLGDAAANVDEITIRYQPESGDADHAHQVSLRFDVGHAPRVVHHAPSLIEGKYVIEIDSHGSFGNVMTERTALFHTGSSISIDVSDGIREKMK